MENKFPPPFPYISMQEHEEILRKAVSDARADTWYKAAEEILRQGGNRQSHVDYFKGKAREASGRGSE